ncbi:VFL3 protein [Gonium pectorale]|uniref:VFL3 protein n=1 Tax=Gonium pectorale TaxID=33097 RepID=A0A150G4X0_GONPE|nr:VFL3 protein [Gonium pectorale]|eukprot:KXZ44868.1 VFL3 protein [Gonium pectorale]
MDLCETVEVTFHGVAYLLTVSTIEGETLCLEVEQKSDCSRWRGDFTSRYIEDITAKTGNFKKFPVFVKMLLSALKQASESVFVDLLTYQDLEVLKSRKAGGQAAPPRTQAPNNKRYLIMTYAAEFDRVHYPLPLLYEENPDPQHLKRIISQLRSEVEALQAEAGSSRRGGGGAGGSDVSVDLRRLREENAALRQQIRQLERSGGAAADSDPEARELSRELRMVRKDRDLLQARVEAAEAELERERGLHRRELRRKAKEQQEVADELGRCKEQIRELKMRIRQLTEELDTRERRQASTDRVRFDPTEYVRQRKEREVSNGGRRSNAPTPPRSGQSSRASSVVGSRPASSERILPVIRSGSPGNSRPTSTERTRPEVKQKLSSFVAGRGSALNGGDDASSVHTDQASQSSKAQVFEDASAEIADIDSRLHALQSFLRMAKSSTAPSTSTTTQA